MSVRRIDTAVRLDGPTRTPQGGLRVDAALARPGVLKYRQPDGSYISEYLSPEEAFNADSLATLAAAPVTKLHPPVMVTRKNWSQYSRGTVGETIRKDEVANVIAATVYLQDADLADAVERGDMKEVSCGYACDLVNKPGVAPNGERYDRLQINRRYNHVAVVPMGRAGSDVALRLDANDNVIDHEEENMKIEKIDGVEYEIDTPAHRAACERRDAAEKARKENDAKVQARADKCDAESARADKAEAELATYRKDAADKARKSLEGAARKVLGPSVKFDAADGKPMADAEIKRLVAAKANPTLRLDGKAEAYVDVLFDMAVAKFDEASAALGLVNATVIEGARIDAEHGGERVDFDKLRADMVERLNNGTATKEKE